MCIGLIVANLLGALKLMAILMPQCCQQVAVKLSGTVRRIIMRWPQECADIPIYYCRIKTLITYNFRGNGTQYEMDLLLCPFFVK